MATYKIQIREISWKTVDVKNCEKIEDATSAMFAALDSSEIAQVGRVQRMVGIGEWNQVFAANRDREYIGVEI